ncbi:MAG TPA: dephospho-CoA kinase [Fimbriimonadaceae bacterium]|nr:dephospho-CoA kinase [Fimbriimonadaceae bacterium]
MDKIAITGGVAEGKSTVLRYCAELGYRTASADAIAAEIFAAHETQMEIARAAGLTVPLDRDLVRNAITDDPDLRRRINAITHPKVLAAIEASEAQVVEVPLLIETCIYGLFRRVWLVTCGLEEQVRRLAKRLGTEDQARAFIRTQLPTRAKLAFADRIVRTNAEEAHVMPIVSEAVQLDLDQFGTW